MLAFVMVTGMYLVSLWPLSRMVVVYTCYKEKIIAAYM